MFWIAMFCLGAPVICMGVLVMAAGVQGVWARMAGGGPLRKPLRRTGALYALGAAFLCFSVFYHPRLEVAAATQVEQDEHEDEDDNGDAESPVRQFLRQLQHLRRGEPVDRLVWRLR